MHQGLLIDNYINPCNFLSLHNIRHVINFSDLFFYNNICKTSPIKLCLHPEKN